MSDGWGEGTARKVAYDLVDDAIKDLLQRTLDEFRYMLGDRNDIGQIRDEIANIKAELGNRWESEGFPWDRVKVGAYFVHSRYLTTDGSRRPETCRIYRLTFAPDRSIREVFYEVGESPGDRVYNMAGEFPAAVKSWVNA